MTERYKYGTLSTKFEIRTYPTLEKAIAARPRNIRPQKERVPVLYNPDGPIGMASFNLVHGYLISRFYPEEGHHNINAKRLAVMLAGIIVNSADWGQIRPAQDLINAYKVAGVEIEFDEITVDDLKTGDLSKDKRFTEFLDQWKDDLVYILGKTNMFFILSSVILLSFTKNLSDKNYEQWFTKRILTFSGTVGDTFTPDNLSPAEFPGISEINSLGGFICANQSIITALYKHILAIAKGGKSFISNVFSEINHLMRGYSLQHLIMIDKYIFQEHPEMLRMVALRGLKDRFSKAIKFLKQYDASEQLYIKLLEDKDKCALLNRKVFDEASIVATTIAKFKSSTFENFYITKSPASDRLQSIVTAYLTARYNLMGVGAGENDANTMGDVEKKNFFDKMIQDVEARYRNPETTADDDINSLIIPQGDIDTL